MIEDLTARKQAARLQAKIQRAGCDPALGAAMADHVLRELPLPPGTVIGGFWPLAGEIDTRALLHGFAALGHCLALPETPPPGSALVFRKWAPGEELIKGRFNTLHPAGEILVPDFILVPLLAFDATGNRLGYGGGYYDRTLAALPDAYRLGCAFAAQEMPEPPTAPDDEKLHAVATELGIIRF